MRSWALAVLLACVACVNDALVPCGDQLCPAKYVCTPTLKLCANGNEIAACENHSEGADCMVGALRGHCTDGACLPSVCGNGKTEYGEACDDGDTSDEGTCSHDCLSDLRCGNGITDAIAGEQCDSGVPGLSGDGCTSTCRAEQDLWIDISPAQLTKRWGARMVRDVAHDQIVLFGGRETTGASDATWIFQGNAWERRAVPTFPEARYSHAMGYDPDLGVVLFGGYNGVTYFNDTWIWNGTKWAKQTIAGMPPSLRRNTTMVYDEPDKTLYLYGGINNFGVAMRDVYKLVKTPTLGWMKLANGPLLKHGYLFYDPRPSTYTGLWIVGANDTDTQMHLYAYQTNDTWVEKTSTRAQPDTFLEPAIGLDGTTPMLYGGKTVAGTVGNALYQWNNSASDPGWELVTLAGGRPTLHSCAVASDGDLVLFGGIDVASQVLAATMRLSTDAAANPTWAFIPTTPLPSGRRGANAIYDGRVGNVVLFGGAAQNTFDDTWRWDSPIWKPAPTGPVSRWHAAMAFDEKRQETVLYGGFRGCSEGAGSGSDPTGCGSGSGGSASPDETFNDTWVLRERWYTQAPSVRPSPRKGAAMAYDSDGQRVVLYGGEYNSGTATTMYAETWAWSGGTWQQLTPTASPPSCADARLTYDHANHVIVMYGGRGDLGSVWTFDGTTWTNVTPATGPVPRELPVFVYHPLRRRVVMFGGRLPSGQLLADTWEWDTETKQWTERHPLSSPQQRFDSAAIYDAKHGGIVMIGGGSTLLQQYDDVWLYTWLDNNTPVERCDGSDADGDQLVDCNDPDCWPSCTPYCPPASSCP